MSNPTDGYKTWVGTVAQNWTGGFTPKSTYLVSYNSRVLGDINLLSLAESFISFDLNLPGAASGDPFYFDTNSANPAQGGSTSIDNGNNGVMVGLSVVQNCVLIYRQRAIYRFDGTNFICLNFANSVIPGSICTSDYTKTNYFVSYNSIYSCDAQNTPPASFGINTIIQDTFLKTGLPNPISYAFDYHTFFYFGNIWYIDFTGQGKNIANAMFVHDERFNEWYIWSIGHNITAFGSYTDSNNVRHMITGDNLGNTYVWGEQYSSDNGLPIEYILRTKYINNQLPSGTKVPAPQFTLVSDPSTEAVVSIAKDYSEVFHKVGSPYAIFSKFNTKEALFPQYKNASIEISGSTTHNRIEILGHTMNLDEDYKTNRAGRP